MEHLQVPVTVEPYVGTSPTEADIVDADDEVIASGVQTSTARCFCKAVNCHDDLREACEHALSYLPAKDGKSWAGDPDSVVQLRIANKLRAAIAKAEETQ